jgi:DNA-binding transcriptional LysR family regulator
MAKITRVTSSWRQSAARGDDISWDSIRLFLTVAECGSVRAAAQATGMAANTVRRLLAGMEREAGALLLERSPRGVRLTDHGEQVFNAGRAMLQQAQAVARMCHGRQPGERAPVRVGVTEGLGAFWLVPRLMDLYRERPGLQVDLRCSMATPDLAGLEVDIAVQLEPPKGDDLVVTRLGWLHVVLFASRDYVARHGQPASKAALDQHQIIEFVAPQVRVDSLRAAMTEQTLRTNVGLRVNTSSAQVLAATHGAGVTALPTYAPLVTHNLVQVAPDWHIVRDIWLAYHPQAAALPQVRQSIAWIKRSFDPQRHPWFGQTFMSPQAVAEYMHRTGTVPTFAGFRE